MRKRRPPIERFRSLYTEADSGCWVWSGYVRPNGYAQFRPGGVALPVYAHRWSYEHFIGPIPLGTEIDHLCRVRACVNPSHLQAVARRVNLLRGETIPAMLASRATCNHGHPFTVENTLRNRDGTRRCKQCTAEHQHRYRTAQRKG